MNYGITWADQDDTLFQTGYNYPTIEGAIEDARKVLVDGPFVVTPESDEMVTGGINRRPLFAYIETIERLAAVLALNQGTGEVEVR